MNGSGSGSWGEDGKGYKVVLDVMPHGRRIKRMKKSFKQRRNGAMSQTDNGVKIETAALGFLRAEATVSNLKPQHELPSSNLIYNLITPSHLYYSLSF